MQYLVHVSHDAENLQFWLWLQDYIKKFFAIPRSEQALSPPWTPTDAASPATKGQDLPASAPGKPKTLPPQLVASLESLGDTKYSAAALPFDTVNSDSWISGETGPSRTVTESVDDANAQAGLNWQACMFFTSPSGGNMTLTDLWQSRFNRLDRRSTA